MGYNWLTRANRVMVSKLDAFAYELHTFVSMGQPLGTEAAPTASVRALPARANPAAA
jgi:biopolymer transport protein ExbB